MNNPYESPKIASEKITPRFITDDHVLRLIRGTDVEEIAISDVSDFQLYGHKHFRELSDPIAREAASAGLDLEVYQSVLWWCLVFMPVSPRGVFFVMHYAFDENSDGDDERYCVLQRQRIGTLTVGCHYLIAYIPLFAAIAALALWLWLG